MITIHRLYHQSLCCALQIEGPTESQQQCRASPSLFPTSEDASHRLEQLPLSLEPIQCLQPSKLFRVDPQTAQQRMIRALTAPPDAVSREFLLMSDASHVITLEPQAGLACPQTAIHQFQAALIGTRSHSACLYA